MNPGDKDRYRCYQCGHEVIAVMADRGTVPTFTDCTKPICDGTMHREYSQVSCVGKEPTHELYLKPEALSDKLSLRKIEVEDEST